MRRIDARAVERVRTEDEKVRRHLYGDTGGTFSNGKCMAIGDKVMCTITTFTGKDNLAIEIYET